MSFQAYLDNIHAKTGKTPNDFKKLAARKGLLKENLKASEIISWLKADFNLGHGHAMAIYATLKKTKDKKESVAESMARHFLGKRSAWKSIFESLLTSLHEFGEDITVAPASSYLSILRGSRKIAIVQISIARMDIGIKLKGVAATKRFQLANSWNTMMTHRVRITDKKQIDVELINWLRSAYEQNA